MREERYRLYAAPFNKDTAEIALNEQYARATKTHVLIYKRGKCPTGYKEITDANAYMLPAADQKWLKEVNLLLMREFMQRNREAEEKAGMKFLEEFEKELQIEREKLAAQGSDAK